MIFLLGPGLSTGAVAVSFREGSIKKYLVSAVIMRKTWELWIFPRVASVKSRSPIRTIGFSVDGRMVLNTIYMYMGASKNRGTPKSSIFIGF